MEWACGPDAAPEATVPLAELELLAPIPRPPSLRDAMTFETHVINSFRKGTLARLAPIDALAERVLGGRRSLTHLLVRGFYTQPPYYNASTAGIVGSGATVRIPRYRNVFDYELEWAVVLGREGADIPPVRHASTSPATRSTPGAPRARGADGGRRPPAARCALGPGRADRR